MTEYRDPSHIDPNKEYQITELAKFIREKMYGIDTREAMALALERVYEDAATGGDANMEVAQARGNFNVLHKRLDNGDEKTQSNKNKIDNLDINKANRKDLEDSNKQIKSLENDKISHGEASSVTKDMISKAVWEDINKGEINIDVNTDMLASGAVTPPKIAKKFDVLKSAKIQENKYIEFADVGEAITYTDTANYWTAEIACPKYGKIQFSKSEWAHGRFLAFLDGANKTVLSYPFWIGSFLNFLYAKDGGTFYEIDCGKLLLTFPDVRKIVFEFRVEDRKTAYVIGENTTALIDYNWGRMGDFEKLDNIPNAATEEYDLIKRKDTEFLANLQSGDVNTETHEINFKEKDSVSTYRLTMPQRGTLRFPLYELDGRYFMIFAGADKKYIQTLNFKYTTGESSWPWLTLTAAEFIVDVAAMREKFAGVVYLYLAVPHEILKEDTFKVLAEKAYYPEELYPFLATDPKLISNKKMVLVKQYPIVSGETGYIYLDNLDLNGNYYDDHDLYVANNDMGPIAGGLPIEAAGNDITVPLQRFENNIITEEGSIKCLSVPKTAGEGKTINAMLIGESTTEDAPFSQFVKEKFDDDVLTVNFVGTRGNAVKHEGRGGWTTEQLVYSAEYNNKSNSFYNPDTQKFDYSYYQAQHPDIPVPDLITIHFGINDPNQNITAARTVENIDFIIRQFKAAKADIKVIVGLTTNLCRIENVAYRTLSRRNKILTTTQALIKAFEDRENENIYLNPMYLTLDPIWDMRYEKRAVNKYNSETTLFATDGTHPSLELGYHKLADCTYNVIKYAMR